MALINQEAKEIHLKIVYYGPSLGGKTTNISYIHAKTEQRPGSSELMEFNMDPERTTFFDFKPFGIGKIRDLDARLHLFSVPGQVIYDASRKLILKNLDAVVFVADSQMERMDENLETLKNLEKNLEQQGYDIKTTPLVFQYNKRDLPNAAPLAELRTALNRFNAPEIEASAQIGRGVMETLQTATKMIVTKLKGGEI